MFHLKICGILCLRYCEICGYLFLQNKPILLDTEMNIKIVEIRDYEKRAPAGAPKTNPIQTQFHAKRAQCRRICPKSTKKCEKTSKSDQKCEKIKKIANLCK